MSNRWLLSILLAAVVGSAATALGFVLSASDSPPAVALAVPVPTVGIPVVVECEPVECEPVACAEPSPEVVDEEGPPPSRTSRMRRNERDPTHVLNPWDNGAGPTLPPSMNVEPPPRMAPTMDEGETSVLNPWN